ncbi:hypothetical protein Taro_033003 [Colocasia esculenta]|uniref:Uncharacterized protein n=1 Tax=Colocasia esculenta TaxID=4460 RepID=A0A843WB63_COLES|nr:hypothetical protein [Colocasia esculenta]
MGVVRFGVRSRQGHVRKATGTQTIFHEELSSSGRLEDGKKVQPSISRTTENATAEDDAIRRRIQIKRRVTSTIAAVFGICRGIAQRRDKVASSISVASIGLLHLSRQAALSRQGRGVYGCRDSAQELVCHPV